jgi:hypothetical protein
MRRSTLFAQSSVVENKRRHLIQRKSTDTPWQSRNTPEFGGQKERNRHAARNQTFSKPLREKADIAIDHPDVAKYVLGYHRDRR